MEEKKNKGGRPTKIKKWVDYFEKVVNEGRNAIIMTDEELHLLTNFEIKNEEEKISYTSFKNWKNKGLIKEEDKEQITRFLSVYKKAIIDQKACLFRKLEGEDDKWQRFAWIIERKFGEWNLKKVVDQNLKVDQPIFPDLKK